LELSKTANFHPPSSMIVRSPAHGVGTTIGKGGLRGPSVTIVRPTSIYFYAI